MIEKNSLTTYVDKLRSHLPRLQELYGVSEISIFGSVARKDNKKSSDVDVLVSFRETPSLFSLEKLRRYLNEILQVRVDVVVDDELEPDFRERILKERVRI